MDRLESELQRLYLPPDAAPGRSRAIVLELALPARWELLAAVWQGVQSELALPAPGIAVSGANGLQLWFSLAEAVPVAQALAFADALRLRYLPEVPQDRVRGRPVQPSADAIALPPAEHAGGQWSAFVAPDLAALFAEEPWLDLPPGRDAQAELLSRLQSVRPADFERALEQLAPAAAPRAATSASLPPPAADEDPRRFLLAVMKDPAVDLRLRIEAAKALLAAR